MSKSRYRISRRNRAVIGGLIIALGSLYALTVSYNIPGVELLWFLVGSALVLLAAMVAAMFLVMLVKGLSAMWRKLLPGARAPAERGDNDATPDTTDDHDGSNRP